jgi:osmoprotectant transport system substrate-binding protein
MYTRRAFLLSMAAGVLAVGGCAPGGSSVAGGAGAKPSITLGSTNFTEQLILAELYAQALEASGYAVTRKFNLGSRLIVAPALASGQIDMYPEYLASYIAFLTNDQTQASADPAATYGNVQAAAEAEGITALQYAPAQNQNGFAITTATADKHSLSTISDLAALNGQLILGGAPECPQYPFCLPGLERVYGLAFKEFKALDAGGPLTVAALLGAQVDVGGLFTSDPAIAANNLVLLRDDKGLQLAQNIVPVARTAVVSRAPSDFATIVNGVSSKLTTPELMGLNRQVGLEKQDPRDVAGRWLRAQGLVT